MTTTQHCFTCEAPAEFIQRTRYFHPAEGTITEVTVGACSHHALQLSGTLEFAPGFYPASNR